MVPQRVNVWRSWVAFGVSWAQKVAKASDKRKQRKSVQVWITWSRHFGSRPKSSKRSNTPYPSTSCIEPYCEFITHFPLAMPSRSLNGATFVASRDAHFCNGRRQASYLASPPKALCSWLDRRLQWEPTPACLTGLTKDQP